MNSGIHRILLAGMAWCLVHSVTLTASGETDLPVPPAPDPYDLVDYIAWYNDVYEIPAADNAAALYLEAYEQVENSTFDWWPVTQAPWTDNVAVRSWLDRNREAMEVFRMATLKPECFFTLKYPESECRLGQSFVNVLLPTLYKHRTLVRAWLAEGYHAAAGGDEAALIDNALVALRSGHHLDASPILIEHLVGVACQNLAYAAMLNALAFSESPEILAVESLPRLEASDRSIPKLSKTFLTERICLLDVTQRLYIPDEKSGQLALFQPEGGGDSVTEEYFLFSFWGRTLQFAIGYERTLGEASAYHDRLARWATEPFHESQEAGRELEMRIESTMNPLLRVILPSLSRAREISERVETTRQATLTVYHLFAYKQEHQQFPESLDELGLDTLPIDLYTGRSLVYRKTAEGFLLYSCGKNAADDRGRHDEHWGDDLPDADYVFWPRPDSPGQ